MRDFLTALLGGKHCAWCNRDKPMTFFERRFNGTGPRKNRPALHRAYWSWVDFNYALGIWKLGWSWHLNRHVDHDDD